MEQVDVGLQLLVFGPRADLHRVNLDLDLLGTDAADHLADRRVEVLGADEAQVQLDRLCEDRVAPEQDGGRALAERVVVDFEVGEAENARQEDSLGLVDAHERLGHFFEVRGELVRDVGREVGVGVVREELDNSGSAWCRRQEGEGNWGHTLSMAS